MRILLIGMFGLYNRGCEAIVWGSAEILRQIYPGAHIAVAVGDESSASIDRGRLPDLEVEILPFIRRPTLAQRAFWRMMRLVQHKAVTRNWGFPFKGWDLILEVGGDTFAIPGFEWRFVADRRIQQKSGTPIALWGMNLDPHLSTSMTKTQLTESFNQYAFIAVRDEPSRQYLSDLQVACPVYRMSDPAFAMQPEVWDVDSIWPQRVEKGVIGLNLSPFAAKRRGVSSETLSGFVEDVVTELVQAGFGILLVPHCFPPACPTGDNDLTVLEPAYKKLQHKFAEWIGILPDGINARQVKHAISRCVLFAGARMHSTIAAWSTGVPVLSLSYSPKSHYLNNAIYGHQRYLVDIATATAPQIRDKLQAMVNEVEQARIDTVNGVCQMVADTQNLIEVLRFSEYA